MKYLTLSLLLLPTLGQAQSIGDIQICEDWGKVSYTVMEIRQLGVPQTELLKKLEYPEDFTKSIVIDAYNTPRFSSESYRIQAAKNFRNETESICLEKLQ